MVEVSRSHLVFAGGRCKNKAQNTLGEALVVDDAAEAAATVSVRGRRTPDGGASPRASEAAAAGSRTAGEPGPDDDAGDDLAPRDAV